MLVQYLFTPIISNEIASGLSGAGDI